MSDYIAVAQTFVEVYPFEGAPLQLQAPTVIGTDVQRNLRAPYGTFSIALVPGGPGGPNALPSWLDLITSMSLVIIGHRRGSFSEITMIGLVTGRAETVEWHTAQGVQRAMVISGSDFGLYYQSFNYYTLGALGMTAGAAIGQALVQAPVAIPNLISQAYQSGTPDTIAVRFYNEAMVGKGTGILGNCYVPYKGNSQLRLQDVIGVAVQPYPHIFVPTNTSLVTTEGSWQQKFLNLFVFPFFEFFVVTAPLQTFGTFPNESSDPLLNQPSGYHFRMSAMPDAPAAAPIMVGRPNPLPKLKVTTETLNEGFTVQGMDLTAWNALSVYQPDTQHVITSSIGFSIDEVRNFYALNPTGLRALMGQDGGGSGTLNFLHATMGAFDFASINRYGYRPEITSVDWWYDPSGTDASQFAAGVGTLLAQVCSYHEPTPFMARAQVTLNMRPDIQLGNRFRYKPYQASSETWDFYIEGVRHQYDFGQGTALTTLTLARGLPTSIYQDGSVNGLLCQIHQGTAQMYGGVFKTGLPKNSAVGLKSFGAGRDLKEYLGQLAPAFATPQNNPPKTS